MTDRMFANCCYGTAFQHLPGAPCPKRRCRHFDVCGEAGDCVAIGQPCLEWEMEDVENRLVAVTDAEWRAAIAKAKAGQ